MSIDFVVLLKRCLFRSFMGAMLTLAVLLAGCAQAKTDKTPLPVKELSAVEKKDKKTKKKIESRKKKKVKKTKPKQENQTEPDSPKQASSNLPNVVVILLDTLRPDFLGFYGHHYETAPFLAELAKKSTVFTEAKSTSSWTAPATASLFTSVYPPQHGVLEGFKAHGERLVELFFDEKVYITLNKLTSERKTISERFKEMGYKTFGMVANTNIGIEMGFSRGFKRFERKNLASAREMVKRLSRITKKIEGNKPYFLYLHFNDTHAPYHIRKGHYHPDKNLTKTKLAGRYLSEIGYMDKYLAKLYEQFNMSENTILVFLSDHGEEFMDHGHLKHGKRLYRELTRVLMMFHSPGMKIAPQRIDVNVSLVDVLPTLMDLVGAKPVEKSEGVSLKPLLLRNKDAESLQQKLSSRTLFAYRLTGDAKKKTALWAAMYGKWKLIDWGDGRRNLFNHAKDPGERTDVSAVNPEMTNKLAGQLTAFQEKIKKSNPVPEPVQIPVNENLFKQLQSLGYIE